MMVFIRRYSVDKICFISFYFVVVCLNLLFICFVNLCCFELFIMVIIMCIGGFVEFKLMERIGEGKWFVVVIGEVVDDMNMDLVVLSMDVVYVKYIDSNLLVEFVLCFVFLLFL